MEDGRITHVALRPTDWPKGEPIPQITYVRVPRGPRYDPPAGFEPFVWDQWLVEDRVERYAGR